MADNTSLFRTNEEAEIFLRMTEGRGWQIFERALERYRQNYINIGLSTPHGPYALETFRHYQTLAQNVVRVPRGIVEEAEQILQTAVDKADVPASLKQLLEKDDL